MVKPKKKVSPKEETKQKGIHDAIKAPTSLLKTQHQLISLIKMFVDPAGRFTTATIDDNLSLTFPSHAICVFASRIASFE